MKRFALAQIVVVHRHAAGRYGLAGARLGEAIRRDERHVFLLLAVYGRYNQQFVPGIGTQYQDAIRARRLQLAGSISNAGWPFGTAVSIDTTSGTASIMPSRIIGKLLVFRPHYRHARTSRTARSSTSLRRAAHRGCVDAPDQIRHDDVG